MLPGRSEEIHTQLYSLDIELIPPNVLLLERAWELSIRLGQSDVFDALGYAVAEAEGGEFWTSDQRFVNAARTAKLPAIRYIA